jgi:hypothetical protein
MTNESTPQGLLSEITQHLTGIFRHMLPGILVVAGARLAYPDWFAGVDVESWQLLLVLAAISLAVGNTWFALNRYGLHQFIDYVLYLTGSNGPARRAPGDSYLDDLGKYAHKSLHTSDASARARQHVAFRASTVLLALTVGEVLLVCEFCHARNSVFANHDLGMIIAGALAFAVGIWQDVITRRIDYYVVNPPPG